MKLRIRQARSRHLLLTGATMLLLALPLAAQKDSAGQNEPNAENAEKRVEKKIVIISSDDDHGHPSFEYKLADKDGLDCREENGKKICVGRMGSMHMPFTGTFLGVELTELTPELSEHLGGPRDAGVLISRVEEDSPAAQAGIQVGDIVTAVESESVASAGELRHAIASREAGAAVKIDLYRDGRQEQVTATLGKRDPQAFFQKHIGGPGMMFDPHALQERIDEALEGIDFEQLDATIKKQLDAVDWDKIKETIRQALDQAMEHHGHPGKPEER
jgi:PDZ domain-containing protein